MNRDDILRMAREIGLDFLFDEESDAKALTDFAALAYAAGAAAERAKVCTHLRLLHDMYTIGSAPDDKIRSNG